MQNQKNKFSPYFTGIILLAIILFAVFGVVEKSNAQETSKWTITDDFEGAGEGLWASYINNTFSYSGNNSVAFFLEEGTENIGQYEYSLGSDLIEGDELWIRIYIYPPIGFDWTSSPVSKILRIVESDASNNATGYHSLLQTRPSNYGCDYTDDIFGYFITGSESNSGQMPPPICQNKREDSFAILTPGEWHSIELYIKISSLNGITRAWHDGELINEYFYPTIPVNGMIPRTRSENWLAHHLLGWWNGGVPQNQIIYFDNFIITNQVPSNVDSFGNNMIGPIDYENNLDTIPPSHPTGLSVS